MDKKHMLASLRMQSVQRWHIVNTTRRQNLAEHSLNVGVIAARIATLCGLDRFEACYWGCLHDLSEVNIGDSPSHVKMMLREKGVDLDDLTAFEQVPEQYRQIVKTADRYEMYFWLLESCGDAHARSTLIWVEKRMNNMVDAMAEPFKTIAMQVLAELRSGPYVDLELAWQS